MWWRLALKCELKTPSCEFPWQKKSAFPSYLSYVWKQPGNYNGWAIYVLYGCIFIEPIKYCLINYRWRTDTGKCALSFLRNPNGFNWLWLFGSVFFLYLNLFSLNLLIDNGSTRSSWKGKPYRWADLRHVLFKVLAHGTQADLFIYSHLYCAFSIVQCSNALYGSWDGEKGTQASHLYEKSMHTLCTISEQPLLAEASTILDGSLDLNPVHFTTPHSWVWWSTSHGPLYDIPAIMSSDLLLYHTSCCTTFSFKLSYGHKYT